MNVLNINRAKKRNKNKMLTSKQAEREDTPRRPQKCDGQEVRKRGHEVKHRRKI